MLFSDSKSFCLSLIIGKYFILKKENINSGFFKNRVSQYAIFFNKLLQTHVFTFTIF